MNKFNSAQGPPTYFLTSQVYIKVAGITMGGSKNEGNTSVTFTHLTHVRM